MTKKILSRVFIVGCPRSGTTLLQSFMSAHPLVFTFPESAFFHKVFSSSRIKRIFGLSSKEAQKGTIDFLKMISKENLINNIPINTLWVKSYISFFANTLDKVTLEKNRRVWVEKTPQHLFYIKRIQKYIEKAKFLHVIRNGKDVVASLYEVTERFPKTWGGSRTINQCIQRWENDLKITRKYLSSRNHVAILYEDLVDNPTKTIKSVCDFIGFEFHGAMLKKRVDESKRILLKEEKWKYDVQKPIVNNKNKKFLSVFNNEERKFLEKSLEKSSASKFYKKLKSDKVIA